MLPNRMIPQISVVIPLYNKGHHIARALNSVLTQNIQTFEVIVVDDGSTDDGVEIVKGFDDSRIRVIQQENQGVSLARNKGVNYAKTNYIAFLDADDEWLPEHLENLLKLFDKFPNAGFISTNYTIVIREGIEKKPKIKNLGFKTECGLIQRFFFILTLGYSPLIISSMGIRKDIFLKYGGFLSGKNWGEDHELWCRIALQESVAYCSTRSAIWHWDSENRLGNISPPVELEPAYFTVKNALSQGVARTEKFHDIYEYLAKKEIEYAIRLLKAGKPKAALSVLLRCKTRRLYHLKILWIILCVFPIPNILSLRTGRFRL